MLYRRPCFDIHKINIICEAVNQCGHVDYKKPVDFRFTVCEVVSLFTFYNFGDT